MIDRFQQETNLYNHGIKFVIGVDEVGRGPLAGPVVAAAVSFKSPLEDSLWDEINDSKKVSEKKRNELSKYILENSNSGIGMASVEEIEEYNILQASLLAMKRAVEAVSINLAEAYIIVDGKFTIPNLHTKQATVINGDGLVHSIAAASIVAKVARDGLMKQYDEQIPGYGFGQNKGYGTSAHCLAIKQLGLSPIHRVSFCGNIV